MTAAGWGFIPLAVLAAVGLTLAFRGHYRRDRDYYRLAADTRAAENRELKDALYNSNESLRRYRAIFADVKDLRSRAHALERIDKGEAP